MMKPIFHYLNYREYLRDYYTEQKAKNKGFSFQKLAWKAGFRSKSFFNELISGKKNLSSASLFSVAKALELQGDAFAYFEALVTFTQAKTQAEKNHGFHRLAQFQRRGKSQMVTQDQFEFYSQWYHNTLRELVTLVDFREDYATLARRVRPAIKPSQAKASVRLMLRLGLLVKVGARYEQTEKALTTGDEIKALAVTQFHQQNMALAAASVTDCPAAERDISCLVAGLSVAGFAAIKSEIQGFRKKLIEIISKDVPAERVYHINFQFFPTSENPNE